VDGGSDQECTYIHKSVYEFYVQQSFMNEIKRSRGQCLESADSNIGRALLLNDKDIFRSICKDIQHVPNKIKEFVLFPCMYNSILRTRVDKSENAIQMASNFMSVLNCCNQFDFYKRDFSDCELREVNLTSAKL